VTSPAFELPIPEGAPRRLAIGWLALGLAALVASGVFSVLLVLSRTPGIQRVIPWVDFFHTALVVHVVLSVVIWFLAFAGVLWSLNSVPGKAVWERVALGLCAVGTAVIAVVPFTGATHPLINNYVPVLQHGGFLAALGMFAAGYALLIARTLFTPAPRTQPPQGADALRVGIYAGALAAAVAMGSLAWSYLGLPATLTGQGYYEFLFWGGGHVLQFTHTLLMLVAWLWLAHGSGVVVRLTPRAAVILFALALAPVAVTPLIYLGQEIVSVGHRVAFTRLMEYGGLAALPLGAVVAWRLLSAAQAPRERRPLRAALIWSIVLFATGGIIGFLIRGVNVVIPAHYHGSIVGVTLAFMGLTYLLLPRLGFRPPALRLAHIQPYVYGGGQLLHILGLAWSGGYGIQRKTPSATGLQNFPEIAGMALMGLGGLIAIIGGLLFLVVAIGAMWPRRGSRRSLE
jgi:hypothetical protein